MITETRVLKSRLDQKVKRVAEQLAMVVCVKSMHLHQLVSTIIRAHIKCLDFKRQNILPCLVSQLIQLV